MTTPKTILITGSNTGLGLEIIKSLCRSPNPYNILLGCRTLSKGTSALESVKREYPSTASTITAVQVDLGSDSSLEKAIETITSEHGGLDILVNNGGASFDREIEAGGMSVREGFNATWDTNVSGTQVLTTLAIPLLLKSSDPRLIFLTSGTSPISETERQDNEAMRRINASPPKGWPKEPARMPITAYRSSKAGLNMLMREWSRILKEDGVKVWCVSPGFLATGLAGFTKEQLLKMGALEPSVGADFMVDVIEGKRDQDVGKAIRKDSIQPW